MGYGRTYIQTWVKLNVIQLLQLNEINMRFYGAEYNNIERGEKPSSILLYSAP
jgi:hypothetical protein